MELNQLNGVITMNNILEELKQELPKNSKIVVATSGGPDSMCLLDHLLKIKNQKQLTLICAHVNHQLRKESAQEALMVKNYCNQNNIIFEMMTIDHYEKGNIENIARTKRYTFFEKLIDKYKASYLITAHHGDDLIETILMRIVRGSNLKGYAGFNKITNMNRYKIYRPLISVTKEEILNYVNKNNIPYALDKTNKDNTYTRNRFRNNVLPLLKNENKKVHQKFLNLSNTLSMYNEYIDKQVNQKLKKIYQNNVLNLDKFSKEDYIIKREIIYHILEKEYQKDLNLINDNHVENILKIIQNKKPNISINLPKNMQVKKEYNKLYLKSNQNVENYKIEFQNFIKLSNGKIIEKVDKSNDTSNYICYLNSQELNFPLWIRNRKNGDKVSIKGLNGTKKLKDIFIDEKIAKEKRETWPILVDNNDEILWIPGLKKTKFDKTKDKNYDIIVKYR